MAAALQCLFRSRLETVIWNVKLILLSIGVFSTLLLFKLAIPYSVNLIFSTIPRVWILLCSFLAPPYLYVVVNFIILSIVASSNYQQNLSKYRIEGNEEDTQPQQQKKRGSETSPSPQMETEIWCGFPSENWSQSSSQSSSIASSSESSPDAWSDIFCVTDSDEKPRLSLDVKSAEPPASEYLVEDASDAMDDTRTAILERHGKPLSRQLKKSDTLDVRPRTESKPTIAASRRNLRKSETFSEKSPARASVSAASSGTVLMTDLSVGQDELNRKVETFIRNFRLQRQASHRHYLATRNRGCRDAICK